MQNDDTYGPTGIRRLPPEEYELVADAVDLWGLERQALQLACVGGLDVAEIGERLGVAADDAAVLLDNARATFEEHEFPDWGRMVLESLQGNGRTPRDTPPGVLADRYGQLREAVLRSPIVTAADLAESAPPGRESWRSLPADVLGRRSGEDQAGWLDREAEREAGERVERLRKGRSGG